MGCRGLLWLCVVRAGVNNFLIFDGIERDWRKLNCKCFS